MANIIQYLIKTVVSLLNAVLDHENLYYRPFAKSKLKDQEQQLGYFVSLQLL